MRRGKVLFGLQLKPSSQGVQKGSSHWSQRTSQEPKGVQKDLKRSNKTFCLRSAKVSEINSAETWKTLRHGSNAEGVTQSLLKLTMCHPVYLYNLIYIYISNLRSRLYQEWFGFTNQGIITLTFTLWNQTRDLQGMTRSSPPLTIPYMLFLSSIFGAARLQTPCEPCAWHASSALCAWLAWCEWRWDLRFLQSEKFGCCISHSWPFMALRISQVAHPLEEKT